jgi:Repeat in HS1/Cortactin
VGWDHREKLQMHESQKDYKTGYEEHHYSVMLFTGSVFRIRTRIRSAFDWSQDPDPEDVNSADMRKNEPKRQIIHQKKLTLWTYLRKHCNVNASIGINCLSRV